VSATTPTVSDRAAVSAARPRIRALHAGAWWLWALGLAAAATRTLNPLILLSLVGVCAFVVSARRSDAPWTASFRAFVVLGAWLLAVRLVFEALFGAVTGDRVLLRLPSLPLPSWLAGVRVGGDVTSAALMAGFCQGLQLATIVICVGAACCLAAPTRLLKSVPGALYEVGVALVVALTLVPQTVTHARRVKEARRLRGRTDHGLRAWAATAGPVLNEALERALQVAAAMDSRGYGRSRDLPARERRWTWAAILTGLIGLCVGLYGLMALATAPIVSVALVVGGVVAALGGVARAGRRSLRTVYRADPWGWQEWTCAASGVVAVVAVAVSQAWWPDPSLGQAPTWPTLSLLALAGVAVAALPAVVAPSPLASSRQLWARR